MSELLSLRNISFPRMDEYFGLWAIEPTRGAAVCQRAQAMCQSGNAEKSATSQPQAQALYLTVNGKTAGSEGDNIAVIQAAGVLMKAPGEWDDGTSTIMLQYAFNQAMNDPAIGGIVLLIDSPGGTVSGTYELAARIQAAAAVKPVVAQVQDLCASAAFWLGSMCQKIYANAGTALIGSIGTYMGVYDTSQWFQKMGIEAIVFSTGPIKGAGLPGTKVTDEQKAHFQGIVNQTQTFFSQAVQAGRKLTAEQVADVATGGVFMAKDAQAKGLIDGIQSLDQTISMLQAEIAGKQKKQASARMAEADIGLKAGHTKEVAMSDTNTNEAGQQNQPAAASLKELKAALPNSSAEFRESCLEQNMTLQQATAAYATHLEKELDQARAAAKPAGAKALAENIGAKGGNESSADPITGFKAIVDGHIKAGMSREKAWTKAVHENPGLHAEFKEACKDLKNK